MNTPNEDVVIRPLPDGTYQVIGGANEVIGRTASEQEALTLACVERRGASVWLEERTTGKVVRVDCPVDSPLERLGEG